MKKEKIIDMWSLAHLIGGVVLARFFMSLGFLFEGFFISLGLMVLWEALEYVDNEKIELYNSVSDVVFGIVGYILAVILM